jgi:mannose-6-phosphate isomerase-like protein (cupin superfamily)
MRKIDIAIRRPDDAQVIRAFGDEMILHLSTDDTGGEFTMWTNVTPPGGGPPPHYHDNEDEWFWPLSGSAEFLNNEEWVRVPAKTAVFMPRGNIHTFRNPGSEPLHMLIQTMPGGFDRFFAECANEFAKGGQPDMQRIVDISAKYGIHYPHD